MKKVILVFTLALLVFGLVGCTESNEPSKESLKYKIDELERKIYELEYENMSLTEEVEYLEWALETAQENTWYAEEYVEELEQLLEDYNINVPNQSLGEAWIEKPMDMPDASSESPQLLETTE